MSAIRNLWVALLLPAVLPVFGNDNVGKVGLSVIQERLNPVEYKIGPEFEKNPAVSIDLSRSFSESEITSMVNQANVGKMILNYLLHYDMESMDLSRLVERIPGNRRPVATREDHIAAIESNYVLVVKLDKVPRDTTSVGSTKQPKFSGRWYLYQLTLDDTEAAALEASYILPGDGPEVRGLKRFNYDRISLVMELVASGNDVRPKLMDRMSRYAKCVTQKEVHDRRSRRTAGRAGRVAKVALSPLLIVK